MNDPYESYKLYNALKLHFETDSYDAIKYNFKTSIKPQSFFNRKDKYFFAKLAKTYGKHFGLIISDKDDFSFYIPEGFAHGFCSLSDNSLIHYKMTNYRDSTLEKGILWNDNTIKIKWPVKKPIISIKDKKNITFREFVKIYG